MSRKASATPAVKEAPLNEMVVAANADARHQLDVIDLQDQHELSLLAIELGYEGSLTVGAIEDEIRFFQQRTVEALLETGKRLILLKSMTPHREFQSRVEMLGFHIKTAQRFMKSAQKISKSDKLSFLSKKVKNSSAFLELITHDDDVIDNLAEMDNFDRMSASQLREAARQLKKDTDFEAEKRIKAEKERDKFEKQLAGNRPVMVPLDVRLDPIKAEIKERQDLFEKLLLAHHQAVAALDSWHAAEVTAQPDYDPEHYVPLPPEARNVLMELVTGAERTANLVGALQAKLDELWGTDIAAARQYLMRETGNAEAQSE